MIPLRVDVRTRRAPVCLLGLMAANVGVFAALVAAGGDTATEWVDRFALVPRELLRGAGDPHALPGVWLTPLTSMFLHAGPVHLAGNLFYLWVFGRPIEDLLGARRFGIFYGACGLAAATIHLASDPTSFVPAVGASGAISGLLGAYAVTYPTGRLRLLWPHVRVPAIAFLGLWIVLQVLSGLDAGAGGIAWWAHVGGFAAGAALARSMWLRPPRRSRLRI